MFLYGLLLLQKMCIPTFVTRYDISGDQTHPLRNGEYTHRRLFRGVKAGVPEQGRQVLMPFCPNERGQECPFMKLLCQKIYSGNILKYNPSVKADSILFNTMTNY